MQLFYFYIFFILLKISEIRCNGCNGLENCTRYKKSLYADSM